MKKALVKKSINLIASAAFALCFISTACTSTLQEDIFDSSETSSQVLEAVSDYENSFVKYDAAYTLGEKPSASELADFHSSIEIKLSQSREPAVLSQLQSLNGLVYLIENKTKKAQDC